MRLVCSRFSFSWFSLGLVSSLLLFTILGLRSDAAPEVIMPEASATITRLVLRNYEIMISSSTDGIRYNIASQTGEVIANDLTSAQMQASYPDIYDRLRPAVARENDAETLMMRVDTVSY